MRLVVSVGVKVLFLTGVAASASDLPWSEAASPRMEALKRQIQKKTATEEFWAEIRTRGAPLVERLPGDDRHVLVTFLYLASKPVNEVLLVSQLSASREPSQFDHLPGTDIWHKTFRMPSDMRLSYGIALQADSSLPDPLNPKHLPAGAGIGPSILELPDAPPQPWIASNSKAPRGKLEEFLIESKVLESRRKAWIYTPAGYDPKRAAPYPLLVCYDGSLYNSPDGMRVPITLDNLIAADKVPPMLAVFIAQSPQPGRNLELSNNQAFVDFVADEVLPHVREKWRATSDPRQVVVTGSSAGGLGSAFAAFRRPDVFGNVLSQSGAFWPGKERDHPEHEWLTRQFESSRRLPIRVVLQVGMLEVVNTPLNGPSILSCNRHLRDVLRAKGYEVTYSEIAGGHEPLNWRGGIGDGVIQLLGNEAKR